MKQKEWYIQQTQLQKLKMYWAQELVTFIKGGKQTYPFSIITWIQMVRIHLKIPNKNPTRRCKHQLNKLNRVMCSHKIYGMNFFLHFFSSFFSLTTIPWLLQRSVISVENFKWWNSIAWIWFSSKKVEEKKLRVIKFLYFMCSFVSSFFCSFFRYENPLVNARICDNQAS